MRTIYKEITQAKNSSYIPVFASGRTADSRYNPQNEAEKIAMGIKNKDGFFIVVGIASGMVIQKILEKSNRNFVVGVEQTEDDITFLKSIKTVNELSKNPRCVLTTTKDLAKNILSFYTPAFYGNLEIIELRGWVLEQAAEREKIQSVIFQALKAVSSDYSVQSHFGKLWTHNIMSNLSLMQSMPPVKIDIPTGKTACIIGAGSSLNEKTDFLKENRDSLFIIATDTGFSFLKKHGIQSDAVVSIDGQNISFSHFLQPNCKDTLFIFELSANPSAIRNVIKNDGKIIFSAGAHPLCFLARQKSTGSFISLFSGAGTVTIAAIDFALQSGFKNTIVLGADFSYTDNTPYTRGTYLDVLYGMQSVRTKTVEKQFLSLAFRTELKKISPKKSTTDVLEGYRLSLEEYLNQKNTCFKKENDMYIITQEQHLKNEQIQAKGEKKAKDLFSLNLKNSFDYNLFIQEIKKEDFSPNKDFFSLSPKDFSLFPLISWLRHHDNKNRDFDYYLKQAYNHIKRYF